MVSWQQEKYLDPGVWDQLRPKVCPEILPSQAALPALPPPYPLPQLSVEPSALPVLPSAFPDASSENINPTLEQFQRTTMVCSTIGIDGHVMRRRVTEEAVILRVGGSANQNASRSLHSERQDISISSTSDQPVTETEETPINACRDTIGHIPNLNHSSVRQPKRQLGDTVLVRKKVKYGGQDNVDEFLLNQVAKHVKYDQLGAVSRDLGITGVEYRRITTPNTFSQKDQIYKVSKPKFI